MEINENTPLSDILDSSEVMTIVSTAHTRLKSKIFDRVSALTWEMNSGGLSSDTATINGKSVLYDKANGVVNNYNELSMLIIEKFNEMKSLAVNKEMEELTELRKCVNTKIEKLSNEIEDIRNYMDSNFDENEEFKRGVNAKYKNRCDFKEVYEKKLKDIDKRLNKVNATEISTSFTEINTNLPKNKGTVHTVNTKVASKDYYKNFIPSIKLGNNGKPIETPPDFSVDSKHRLDLPGFGLCVESTGGNAVVFHYDSGTNMYYYSNNPNVNWETFNYKESTSKITLEDMKKSTIKGGIIPW